MVATWSHVKMISFSWRRGCNLGRGRVYYRRLGRSWFSQGLGRDWIWFRRDLTFRSSLSLRPRLFAGATLPIRPKQLVGPNLPTWTSLIATANLSSWQKTAVESPQMALGVSLWCLDLSSSPDSGLWAQGRPSSFIVLWVEAVNTMLSSRVILPFLYLWSGLNHRSELSFWTVMMLLAETEVACMTSDGIIILI